MISKPVQISHRRPAAPLVAAVTVALLLGACREDDAAANGDAGGDLAARALLDDLSPGHARLEVSGVIETTGTRDTLSGDSRYAGDAADLFRPARSRAGRGTNADGPYELVLYGDAIHAEQDAGTTVRAWLSLTLPEGAAPGLYEVSGQRGGDAQVWARLAGDGYGWDYTNGLSGSLAIVGIDGALTAAFDITLMRGESEITILGAANTLPLTPQAEVVYTISGPDGAREELGNPVGRPVGADGDFQLTMGRDLYLRLPAGFESGSYALVMRANGPEEAEMRLMDQPYESLAGEITLQRSENALSGEFAFTAEGAAPISVNGRFAGVTLPE